MLNFFKQPLLHFIVLGAFLFLFYHVEPAAEQARQSAVVDKHIVVSRAALLDYMQYQAKAFEPTLFNERLNAMSKEERAQVIKDYVREEALYREALTMHMDAGDYIIKQRLVQKVEFLLENMVADSINPTEEQLVAFYDKNLNDYQVAPVYSFTHIFFSAENGGQQAALARATAQLAKSSSIGFTDASQYGDRFPFLQNYVERTRDFVVNNFSEAFVAELDKLQTSSSTWYGPIESRYGYHLVMLVSRLAATTPALDAIRPRVLDDYRYEALARNRQQAELDVVATYQVEEQLDVPL